VRHSRARCLKGSGDGGGDDLGARRGDRPGGAPDEAFAVIEATFALKIAG
jgi:hypothetical protein